MKGYKKVFIGFLVIVTFLIWIADVNGAIEKENETVLESGLTKVTKAVNNNELAPYYINSYGIEMNETEYKNLENLGFSTLAIEMMDEEIFNENKDIHATPLVSTTTYAEEKEVKTVDPVTKEEHIQHQTTILDKEEYFKRVNSGR